MPDSYAIKESRVQEALASITLETKPNLTHLAAEFNVPYYQLRNRYNGMNTKDSHSYALTKHEEQTLYQYIQRLDKLKMSCRRTMLARAANFILRERPDLSRHVNSY